MLDGEREALLRPRELVAWLGIRPGQVVADLGAGPGLLTLPLARAVGPRGQVIATDIDGAALDELRRRAEAAGLSQIDVHQVAADDPGLPAASVDLALVAHVHPYLSDGEAWLRRLAPALRPAARLAAVGFASGRERLLADAEGAGLELVDEAPRLLPAQYLVLFAAKEP